MKNYNTMVWKLVKQRCAYKKILKFITPYWISTVNFLTDIKFFKN